MFREPHIFILAATTLKNVVDQIKDEQWNMIMPEDFSKSQPGDVTLREIINSHAYDLAWVPDMLLGKTMDDAGKAKFDGDLLDGDAKGKFAEYVKNAILGAREVTEPERIVHCSFGDFTTEDYLQQITMFHGLRAYDIARAIGGDTNLPEALVEGLWDEIVPRADEFRKIGVLPNPVDVPEDAPLQTQLLGLTGRQPL